MTTKQDPPNGLVCTVSAAEQEAMNQGEPTGEKLFEEIEQAREAYEKIHGPSCKVSLVVREVDAGGDDHDRTIR